MKSTGIQKILNPVKGDVWYVSEMDHGYFREIRYLVPIGEGRFETFCTPEFRSRGSSGTMERMLELYSPQIPQEEAALLKLLQILSILSSGDATSEVYNTLIELDI